MIRLALKGLVARRLRGALTAVAVLLGVTMVAGTFILTDTIEAAFEDLFAAQTRGADAVVSSRPAIDADFSVPEPFDAGVVERIEALPEVSAVAGQITDVAVVVGRDGKIVGGGGAPTIAASLPPRPFSPLTVASGRGPRGPDEIALDAETAKDAGFAIGDRVEVATDRPKRPFTLTGTVTFGTAGSIGGARLVVFDLPAAQRLFEKENRLDGALIAANDGVTPDELVRAVRTVLPPDVQVRTSAEELERQLADLGEGLSFLTSALLAFGFIAVLVGGFIIFNTFSITVAQRMRELALLRTLGATRRQVLQAILVEAALIGVLASLIGLAAGYGFAVAINGVFEAIGIDLPSTDPVFKARTIAVALLVGVVVTVAGATLPALRATRVAPVEALREAAVPPPDRRRRSVTVVAVVLVLAGAGLVATSLLGDTGSADARVAGAGGGALLLVLGIAMLSPRLVRPAARLVGAPLERGTNVVGRLARENAARNPGRTAVTASALMIGLALVLFVTVFANGLRASFDEVVERQFAGDLAVLHDDGFSDIPAAAADAVERVPGVAAASRLKGTETRIAGLPGTTWTTGIEAGSFPRVYRFEWVERGNPAAGALIDEERATSAGLEVGDEIELTGTTGRRVTLPVAGIYSDSGVLGDVTVPLAALDRISASERISSVFVELEPGTSRAAAQRDVERALAAFPEARARDQAELKRENGDRVNQLLSLFYALLALSLVISAFGIVNTLTLAVHERVRELGVLRAVGMTRREVRRLIRYESVITALLGAALGLVLGLFFAFVVTRALASEGIGFTVPVGQVVIFIAFAVVLGILAAILPARRASRLDVVAAVSYE